MIRVVTDKNLWGRVVGFMGRGRHVFLVKLDQGGMAVVRDTDCKVIKEVKDEKESA